MRLRIEPDPAREAFVVTQGKRYGIAPAYDELHAYKAFCDTRLYSVIVSHDNITNERQIPDYRWHVSVAGESYLPKWADFVAIVQEVRPGVMFCVPMPPRQFWLNVNPNVLHVWEIRDEMLTRQWREEARATHAGQRAGRFPGRAEPS